MRKILHSLLTLLLALPVIAQTGFNFKGLVADASGNPLTNQIITVRITIKEGTTIKWREEHNNVHTDAYGIFSVAMGEGNRVAGVATFDEVDWNNTNMNYSVEVDSGSGYQLLVSNEAFQYMPYAKMATKINGVQDKVEIGGNDSSSGLKLYTGGDLTSSFTLVRFKATGINSGSEILELNLPASAPADAQFIEMYKGGIVWTVYADGTQEMDGDLNIQGEVHGSDSGDADMKAYIYGSVLAAGNPVSGSSSDGFTVSKQGTGHYRITFDTSPGSSSRYIVVATKSYNTAPFFTTVLQYTNYFDVYIFDASGNAVDGGFNFIVFKK